MNKSKFVALLVGLAVNSSVLAQGGGNMYFGGSIGKAESKEDACSIAPPGFTCDRKGEGAWSVFAGGMLGKYIGVEGAHHNLGKIVEVADTTGQRAWVKTSMGTMVAFAAVPIQSLTFYVKGGGYYANSTQTGSSSTAEVVSKNKQWTYGAGVSWDMFRHFGMRAEFQRFNNLGGQEIGFRTDVDLMSLGAYLKF